MNSPVEQIKERLTIADVVSSYIKLEKTGINLKARCPFHNEKTASFFVSPARGSYYCFGCSASGDIFTFVEEFEGLDFKGALKLLAAKAGVTLTYERSEDKNEKDRLYKAVEEAASYFVANLSKKKEVQKYLETRGIKEGTIKDFSIGFANDDWRDLYNELKKNGFSDVEMEKAGLVIKSDKAGAGEQLRYYDRFRKRIMFPISDSSGRIIAFSGRVFQGDEKSAKYVNSPETPIFSKSATLYGLDRAKESIRKNNFSILVEGQIDLVLSHQAGYRNTVATSGTALSDTTVNKENVVTNLGLIRRLSENLVLAFDGDKAGASACERAGAIALSLGMDVKVAEIPDGMDPADLISKNGVDAWKEAVKRSKHIIEFLLDRVIKDGGGDARKVGREIKNKVLPYLYFIDSSIEKSHFIKKISTLSGVSEDALKDDLKKAGEDLKYEKKDIEQAVSSGREMFRKDYILRRLLGIVLWQRGVKSKDVDVEHVVPEIESILNKKIDEILPTLSAKQEDLIYEAEVFYGGGGDLDRDIKEMLSNLKEELLREELGRAMREMYDEKNKEKPELLKRVKEINEKIQNIKNNRK